jgi:hypothetical protein
MLAQVFRLSAEMWRELAKLNSNTESASLRDMAHQLDLAARELQKTGMVLDIPRLCELEKVELHARKPAA